MAGFGFGGGMLDEQADISERRTDFTAKMAELIARNPDLDVNGLLNLVDNAAGTDNTLRGVYNRENLTPYVEGRNRAKRVDVYNTLQNWLKANPGATMADAQQAYYMYTGGNGGDPQMLSGFLDQAKQRKAMMDQQEKERQLALTLQNRGAVQGAARDLLLQYGDPVKAKEAFVQQFGTDKPYGVGADSLFTVDALERLNTERAAETMLKLRQLAGPNGDIRAAMSIMGNQISPEIRTVVDKMVAEEENQKLQGLNSKIGDSSAMNVFAKNALYAGQSAEDAFRGFILSQYGGTLEEAQAKGLNIAVAKKTFDSLFTGLQGLKAKDDEAARKQGLVSLSDFWVKDPLAASYARNNKLPELEAKILEDANNRGLTRFTAMDARRIIRDITDRLTVVAEDNFKSLDGQITGSVQKMRDDLISTSQKAAEDWWMKNSKGVADAKGLTDPKFAPLMKSLGSEYNFADTVVAAQADKILSDWAQEGSGDPMILIAKVRDGLNRDEFKGANIGAITEKARAQAEISYGRFNHTKPITATDFISSANAQIQTYANEIKADIDAALSKDFSNPTELNAAIIGLTEALQGANGMPADLQEEYTQRQANNNWLLVGQAVPPDTYAALSKKATETFSPLAEEAGELLMTLKELQAVTLAKQETVKMQTGGGKYDFSKLPPEVQSGYIPAPQFTPTAQTQIGRGFQSIGHAIRENFRGIENREAYAPFFEGASPIGLITPQTAEQATINKQVTAILSDSNVDAYVSRNPAALELLKTDPQRFVQIFNEALITNAAPAGTTQQPQ